MDSTVTEIAPDVFRISTYHPKYKMQFNQFVVKDDEPLLFHTALRRMFPETRAAVARVVDPAAIRWIAYSHFEPDECGALNEWLAVAPRAQAVCNFVGKLVMLDDFADREARALADGEVLDLGRHRVRHLLTPHVPHCWDAGLLFDETERTLFCSDLFFHVGDPEPLTSADLAGRAKDSILKSRGGPMAHDVPFTADTVPTLHRLAELRPRRLAVMHGSSFEGDGAQALRDLASVFAETLAG